MRVSGSRIKWLLLVMSLGGLSILIVYAMRGSRERESEKEKVFSVIYEQNGAEERIDGFYSQEVLYFCIPGYVQTQDIRLEMESAYELVIEDKILKKGDSLSGLEPERLYHVVYGKTKEAGQELDVMFMQGSKLPVLQITTASGSLDYIHSEKGNFESGYMRVTDADGQSMELLKLESLSGRGNTAWDAAKKSYTLKLDAAAQLLGMDKEKTWVLNANYYDGAYIRNQIGFEMAQAGGIKYVPDSRFAELYINHEYMGLYQLTEKVKKGKNRVDIGDGCLLEIDYRERACEEQSYIMLENEQPIVIHSPDQGENVRGRVKQFFEWFSARMEQGTLPLEQMDIESFAKMFVMEELLQDMDFGYSSHYLYLDLEHEILSDGTVWDMDNTMGRGTAANPERLFAVSYDLEYNNLSRWYARLYENEEFRRLAAEEYRENFRPMLEQLVNGGIETRIEQLQASIQMDEKRFPEVRSSFMGEASLEEHISYLLSYLQGKREVMDECFGKGAAISDEPAELPPLERQPSAFEQPVPQEQAQEQGMADFFMQYRFLLILLVMFIIHMILWYRCKKMGK